MEMELRSFTKMSLVHSDGLEYPQLRKMAEPKQALLL